MKPSNTIYYYHTCQCHGKPGGSNRVHRSSPADYPKSQGLLYAVYTQCVLEVLSSSG